MKTNDFSDILQALEQVRESGKEILVITHERPDGDAVGSFSAMVELLRSNGFAAAWYLQDPVPDCYTSFLDGENAKITSAADVNERYSLIFNVDASTVKRLGISPAAFEEITIPVVTLDHHPDNEHFGTWSYVDPKACSACEVVYCFARHAQWQITPRASTLLMLGIVTDSGCFRFSNTTPRCMQIAADLLENGADHARIIDRAYLSKPFPMALFEAELFRSALRTALEGRFAWFTITNELLAKYSIDIRNTEQLIENLRSIDGVTVAALLKSTKSPGIFKISLRSKDPNVSVGKVARRLNGGGHEMAAGGTIFAKSLEDAENILLKHVEQEMKNETQP